MCIYIYIYIYICVYKDTVYVNANKEDLKSIIEINNIKQLCEYELN